MSAKLAMTTLTAAFSRRCPALRSMRVRPGLTLASVSMLALAVGLAAAGFSLVDAIYLRPAPFRNPDRLAYVRIPGLSEAPGFLGVLSTSPVVEAVGASDTDTVLVQTGTGNHAASMATVTRGMSELLGGLRAAQGVPIGVVRAEAPDGVVVSERVLDTWFGRERNIIGRTIRVDGRQHVIVGVMSSAFRFPRPSTVLWTTSGLGQRLAVSGVYVRFAGAIPRAAAVSALASLAASHVSGVQPRLARACCLSRSAQMCLACGS